MTEAFDPKTAGNLSRARDYLARFAQGVVPHVIAGAKNSDIGDDGDDSVRHLNQCKDDGWRKLSQ